MLLEKQMYFLPTCTVSTWGKNIILKGVGEEYDFWEKYIPLHRDPEKDVHVCLKGFFEGNSPISNFRTEHILSEREVSDLVEACTAVLEQYNSPAALEKGIADRTFSPLGVYFLKKLLDQEGDLDYRGV